MLSTIHSRRSWFIHPSNSKTESRKKFREIRRQIPLAYRKSAEDAAANILMQENIFLQSNHIACYFSFADEFDATPIMEMIWQSKKNCYLPVLTPEKTLKFFSYQKGDALQKNRYSIMEPVNTKEIPAEELDIVIVPLIAFDLSGNRLGTGGGYYDKTFSFLQKNPGIKPLMIGLGFAAQQAELLLREEWDIQLDAVLTEKNLFNINK